MEANVAYGIVVGMLIVVNLVLAIDLSMKYRLCSHLRRLFMPKIKIMYVPMEKQGCEGCVLDRCDECSRNYYDLYSNVEPDDADDCGEPPVESDNDCDGPTGESDNDCEEESPCGGCGGEHYEECKEEDCPEVEKDEKA